MRRLAPLALLIATACGGDALAPAALDTRNEACASCRMTVSDPGFAAQIVAPGEEPRFFDDIGCLASYLKTHASAGAALYVADHRTRAWTPAARAVYTRVASDTPMASHILAHADVASRDEDAATRGGQPVPAGDILAAAGSRP